MSATSMAASAPPLVKTKSSEKGPVKTAWGKQSPEKPLITAVGASRKYSVSSPPTQSTTPTASSSPSKQPSEKLPTPLENAAPSQPSPSKKQLSPGKSNKVVENPPTQPSTPSPAPATTPATANSAPTRLTDASSSITGSSTSTTNAAEVPDFESPLGIFGPQLQQRESEDLCFSMGMTLQEVQKLVAIFNDIDLTCSGLINLREFYFLLDTPQNKYTSAILNFAARRSDPVKLDIDDFVRIVCTFVLMSQTDIYRFCFNTFDEDDSGALSKDEFVVMCDSIQIKGDGFFQGNFRKAMDAFDANHDGLLDFTEFIEMNRKFPLVFWPLFYFQETVQDKTLGKRVWTRIHSRQLKIDAWRNYMTRFLGRAPPLTWQERWCGCISRDQRLRLIAAQLYDQDQLRLKLKQRQAGAPGEKAQKADRKMQQKGSAKAGSSRNIASSSGKRNIGRPGKA